MKQFLSLISLILIALTAYPQQSVKLLYDNEWRGCTSLSKAAFFRIVNYDRYGKPVGKVIDYYITSEVLSETDGALFIDKNDDSKSKFIGYSKGYFKNGKRAFEILHDNQGNRISHKTWHENGNLRMESTYKNGRLDGLYYLYYQNGEPHRVYKYTNGIVDKSYLEFDESGYCQGVFFEGFESYQDLRDWSIPKDNNFSASIIPEKGLLMTNKSNFAYVCKTEFIFDLEENFSIATFIDFKKGSRKDGQGIMWGIENWDNYFYFFITADGYYRIGVKEKGKDIPFQKWTPTSLINKNKQRNRLSLTKVDDKYHFNINGNNVYSSNFYSFKGDGIGFYLSGKKEVLFEGLMIKQTLSESEFGGSGSGFFIDYRGYIATNYHVIENAKEIEVNFTRDGKLHTFKAEVVKSDKQNDLAIIKITDNSFKSFDNIPYVFQTVQCDVGAGVFALGYPFTTVMGSDIKFTDGKISSKTGYQGDETSYQISVPIQPGNSGGPLFDDNGNLIGITSAGLNRQYFENVNYAIKSLYLKKLIDELSVTIRLPNDRTIANKILTEKIKILSDYVVWISVK